jgi:nicotinamidase/pyrazinamidase
MEKEPTALLLVDIQNDFIQGGALPVPEGHLIIPFIEALMQKEYTLKIASKDWHPHDHISFAQTHPGKVVGEIIDVEGNPQVLWPKHCVQGTWGAEWAPGWDSSKIDYVVYKGTEKYIDSYSMFFDNGHRKSTGLTEYLIEHQIRRLHIAGLATDYCVKYTVLDALHLNFKVFLITHACRGVNIHPQDSLNALREMEFAGALTVSLELI